MLIDQALAEPDAGDAVLLLVEEERCKRCGQPLRPTYDYPFIRCKCPYCGRLWHE